MSVNGILAFFSIIKVVSVVPHTYWLEMLFSSCLSGGVEPVNLLLSFFAKAKFGSEGALAFDAYIHLLKAATVLGNFPVFTFRFSVVGWLPTSRHSLPKFLIVQSVFTRRANWIQCILLFVATV